ncbi:hypothetical protein CLV36_11579 [Laceyella sediminis]|uniref:Uncharacterized protein n=1 Tax=Laceyella sediminis TaxID=573074 RepID=A0ABX5EKG4_9BACL|nr:hypothetical protein CLV36_11579 [Laceyella sediminis]
MTTDTPVKKYTLNNPLKKWVRCKQNYHYKPVFRNQYYPFMVNPA